MKARSLVPAIILLATFLTVSCSKQEDPVREAVSHKDDYQGKPPAVNVAQ